MLYYPPQFVKTYFGEIERRPMQQEMITQGQNSQDGPQVIYQPQTSQEDKIIAVVKKASPSVVSVVATKDVPVVYSPFFNDPFFQQFFPQLTPQTPQNQQKTQKQVSAGTGFVVSKDGLVLTNKHVVSDDEADYTVVTTDGEKHEAKVVARDPFEDLALLRVTGISLLPLELGDSDALAQGQTVIAIGNALGEFDNTTSLGVVSGLRRSVTANGKGVESERLRELIQTDAAINPGNSGGPLLNLAGEVIGVNVAMAEGAQNIGFAIPINRAKKDIRDVREKGKISYPFLGVRTMTINDSIQKANNLSIDYGALVVRGQQAGELAVMPGSPADRAGIVENDIILEISGKKITVENSLPDLIAKHNVGETIIIKILHRGEEKTVQAILAERP